MEGEWLTLLSSRFTSSKEPGIHLIGVWVHFIDDLGILEDGGISGHCMNSKSGSSNS
jgi:hypothetical protein